RLRMTVFAQSLRECETDAAAGRVAHDRDVSTACAGGELVIERQHEREDVVNVVLRRVWIVRRGDSATQNVDKLRHEVPVLWSEAVDVRTTMQIDDVFFTRVLFRRHS